MSPQLRAIPLIVIGVLLNAFAQICLKKGLVHGMETNLGAIVRLVFTPWILAGLGCYGVSVLVWMKALSLVDASYAYPFLALGFLVNALMARAFLGEAIPPLRWIALAIIVAGVALQAFSGKS
jgi:multidrug transporter EmrE-like cation transporter